MDRRDRFHPQLIITVIEEHSNLTAYLVIDSIIRGRSVGGLRMLPDVSLEEIRELARTMTLKYAFTGLKLGGAKAGIAADPELPPAEKVRVLVNFGKALGPLLENRSYVPRPDMGTDQTELRAMSTAIGLKKSTGRKPAGGKSALYTSFSVVAGAIQGLRSIKMNVSGSTVAIEGFGKVGSSVARAFSELGAKVVAISTQHGTTYSPKGLDVEKLIQLSRSYGSKVTMAYPDAETIGKSELMELGVDVLSPCARHHSINEENAHKIKAKVISPGANNPITRDAERYLSQRGVVCLPDFTTNCGGVLGDAMEFSGLPENFIGEFIVEKIGKKISKILKAAEENKMPPRDFIEPVVLERSFRVKQAAEKPGPIDRALRAGVELHRRGLIPQFVVRSVSPRYFAEMLRD